MHTTWFPVSFSRWFGTDLMYVINQGMAPAGPELHASCHFQIQIKPTPETIWCCIISAVPNQRTIGVAACTALLSLKASYGSGEARAAGWSAEIRGLTS